MPYHDNIIIYTGNSDYTTSVGLAQARPNYTFPISFVIMKCIFGNYICSEWNN